MYPQQPQQPQTRQPLGQNLQGLAGLLMQQQIMRSLFGDASMMNPNQAALGQMPSPQTAPPGGQGSGAIRPMGVPQPGSRAPQLPIPPAGGAYPMANPPPGARPPSASPPQGGLGRLLGGGPVSGGFRVNDDPQENEEYEPQTETGKYLSERYEQSVERSRQEDQMDKLLTPSEKEARINTIMQEIDELYNQPDSPERDQRIQELQQEIEELRTPEE